MNAPLLFPGECREAGSYSVTALQESWPERWEEVRVLKRAIYVYSVIKYEGPFSDDIYETRWCFRITSHGPVMSGGIRCNEHT
jgi:hypothetical protein